MKTFTTTLALVLTVSVLVASAVGSQLHVKLLGHRPNMLIIINGQRFVSPQNVVTLDGLTAGKYPIQVLRPTYWGTSGLVFQGTVEVPRETIVTASITPQGMTVQREQILFSQQPNYWDQNSGTGHHGQHGHGFQNPNGNGGFVSMCPPPPPVYEPVMLGMHPDMFLRLKEQVRNASFDSDQIRVAKQGIRMNRVTSDQVRQLMELLSFESSRLEIAKFGYRFVDDPQNFFIVNDVFWFSSSIRELDRYIGQS